MAGLFSSAQVDSSQVHPSIIYHLILLGSRSACTLVQLTFSKRQGTPSTGHQSIASPHIKTDNQAHFSQMVRGSHLHLETHIDTENMQTPHRVAPARPRDRSQEVDMLFNRECK